MSLKIFHIFFITIVLLLSGFLFFHGLSRQETGLTRFGAVLFLLLIPYLFWFQKKMRHLSIGIVFLLFADDLLACPVCFGDPDSLMIHGTKTGVLFLAGLISLLLILISTVGFSWYLRSKKQKAPA